MQSLNSIPLFFASWPRSVSWSWPSHHKVTWPPLGNFWYNVFKSLAVTSQILLVDSLHNNLHWSQVYSLSSLENNYFEGEITDGVAVIRIVGFDRTHYSQMVQFWHKKMMVTLNNCQIKQSKFATDLEILFRNYTTLERSDVTFDLSNWDMLGTKLLDIAQLPTTKEYTKGLLSGHKWLKLPTPKR